MNNYHRHMNYTVNGSHLHVSPCSFGRSAREEDPPIPVIILDDTEKAFAARVDAAYDLLRSYCGRTTVAAAVRAAERPEPVRPAEPNRFGAHVYVGVTRQEAVNLTNGHCRWYVQGGRAYAWDDLPLPIEIPPEGE